MNFRAFPWLGSAAGLGFAFALSLSACLQDGPSTETGNPNLGGTLTDAQGNSIPGLVKLYWLPAPAADGVDNTAPLPPTLARIDTVKSDGKWGFGSLPAAAYSVEGVDAAAVRFGLLRGLVLADPKDTLVRALAVSHPGRIRGRATRGPNALPAGIQAHEKIFVRLGGADRWTQTDAAGDYAIENVPAGTYRMSFAAADGHYLTAYLEDVAVVSGADVAAQQVDLEWSRFLLPPAVRGVTVAPDSAANLVRLEWRAVPLSGNAQAVFEVARRDSLGMVSLIHLGADTTFVDSLGMLAPGTVLTYMVRAINPQGEKGPFYTLPPVIAPGRQPDGPAVGLLEGVVHARGAPLASMRVRLYAIPSAPGSPDSLPDTAVLRDRALTDAAGRWRFVDLPAGAYTVTAEGKPGTAALAMGLVPRASGLRLDSLEPQATGTVTGAATRNKQWVTSFDKGDENIHVSLAGAPFQMLTGFGSPPEGASFAFQNVPPGTYQVIVYPLPIGFFLADTQTVSVAPGTTVKLPAVVKPGYNPNAPPPKLASLSITTSTRERVSLAWDAVATGYPYLKGYRVLRLSEDLRALDSSAIIPDLHWEDDVSKVAAGTRLKYVVRVVSVTLREGSPGGDVAGPIPHTVSDR